MKNQTCGFDDGMGLCGLQLKDDRSVTIILMALHHRNDGTFCTVAAVYDRRYFVHSRKNRRS